MAPTKPFGVPEIISISFWGGVWGVIFALVLPRWFSGTAYWIAAFVGGGLVLTIVFVFVVWPLKVGGLPRNLPGLFVVGFLLNAAWGIGWALLLHWLERMRSS
jgi:ABC-type Fe3+-siderophore transport system permease subunit